MIAFLYLRGVTPFKFLHPRHYCEAELHVFRTFRPPRVVTQILTWDVSLVRLSGLYPVWLKTHAAVHKLDDARGFTAKSPRRDSTSPRTI